MQVWETAWDVEEWLKSKSCLFTVDFYAYQHVDDGEDVGEEGAVGQARV